MKIRLGESIRRLRKESDFTQEQLAKAMSYDSMGETGMAMIENFIAVEPEESALRHLWTNIRDEDEI